MLAKLKQNKACLVWKRDGERRGGGGVIRGELIGSYLAPYLNGAILSQLYTISLSISKFLNQADTLLGYLGSRGKQAKKKIKKLG